MAGELVVADNQYQLRDLLIGVGTKYRWYQTLPTWWGPGDPRTQRTPYSATDGVRGGRDLQGSKFVSGRLVLLGDDQADLQQLLDDLSVAWAPSDENLPFVAQVLTQKRRRYGRPARIAVVPDLAIAGNMMIVAVEFEALDPFVYGDLEHSVTTGVPAGGEGIAPPFTPPFTLPASTSTGAVTVFNAGNAPAPWTARLDGPLTNPVVTHAGQDRQLKFDNNGGLDIASSQFVLLDSQGESVLYDNTGDRRATLNLGSDWFDLDAGSNSILFAAETGTGTLTLFWRDAYRT